ncbi:hypothetical protein E2C01_067383 [Portunus trituberculatus]|uniref:Uncharacterized protein n=1 Tax=Portunus trituberculatus TaxID=210409 RepID=A0A5B7HTG7_PORTR|nr:hypothetical protein [Portunus trituberculatus]
MKARRVRKSSLHPFLPTPGPHHHLSPHSTSFPLHQLLHPVSTPSLLHHLSPYSASSPFTASSCTHEVLRKHSRSKLCWACIPDNNISQLERRDM